MISFYESQLILLFEIHGHLLDVVQLSNGHRDSNENLKTQITLV